MSTPRISVLIPTRNYARYLPEAIDSVLGQDFKEFELIISDDASTDNSAEIIWDRAGNDPRIVAFTHQQNLGMVENWNFCLKQAKGDFIKYVFGDDCLAKPDCLTRMAEALDENKSAVLAISARNIIDENSNLITVRSDFGGSGLSSGREVILQCLEQNKNVIGEPSVVLFRKNAAARGFCGDYRQLPDLEMWFHLLEQGDAVYLDEPLCSFRKHGLQQTAKNRAGQLDLKENAAILAEYYGHEWLQKAASPRLLFRQIYALRKAPEPRTDAALQLESQLLRRLGKANYSAYWLEYKFGKMGANLRRMLVKHVFRKPVV